MNARDEPSYLAFARVAAKDSNPIIGPTLIRELVDRIDRDAKALKAAKPRTITTVQELEALAFGSAVLTSDESDTVVLKAEGDVFRNQSGYAVNALTLWSYGTQPFTVLWEPTP